MKSIKKIIAVGLAAGIVAAAGAVYAAGIKTPAETVSELTGKSLEDVQQERQSGKTHGTIASENGKLEDFKKQMLESKKAILDQRVKDGRLTQQQADEIYNAIKENQTSCDGTGSAGIGRKYGVGFGRGINGNSGNGAGAGLGKGRGQGGRGMMGRGAGVCGGAGMNWNNQK